MKIPMLVALAALASAAVACRKEAAPVTTRAAPTEAGANGVCAHGVLQPICPKCNPKVAAVFQAKGDWCKEHGMPESVCPICHPERGGRPARDISVKPSDKPADALPPDGTKIRLKSKEAARLAGITVAVADSRNVGAGVTVVAKISYDGRKLAHVNARSRGVVRSLSAELGTKVDKGTTLAEIESGEVGADRSRARGASVRIESAKKNFDRVQSLRTDGLGTEKDLNEARRELEAAKAEHAALSAGLVVAGGGGAGGVYLLTSPLAGMVTKREATIGKLVGTDEVLFEIVDTSTMWADLEIPERDLTSVAREQEAVIELDGVRDRQFRGKVDFLSPALDAHTRTASARVPLSNADAALRANMYGKARILSGKARTGTFLPVGAVQRVKTEHVVFIRTAEDVFETRRVTLGAREGATVEIATGLKPGETVAHDGSFLLKTEISKDAIGSGCCGED